MVASNEASDHVHAASPSSSSDSYRYPFAAAPDIIRSNQKDVYFQGVLLEQLSTILRKLYGARFLHTYTSEARTFTELLYLGLTTFIGNRTLGEEYCDIIQVESPNLHLPSIHRRAGYILSTVLLPYIFTKLLPAFRNRIRLKLESNLRRLSQTKDGQLPPQKSPSHRLQTYLLSNLPTLTSPSPFYALSLSTFYFTGSYYHLSKRLFSLRYIFTKRLAPTDQRVGYEVLGVLLVLQMAVQGWLHLHSTLQNGPPSLANSGSAAGGSAIIDGGVELGLGPHTHSENVLLEGPTHHLIKSGIETSTHTPVLPAELPRYDLKEPTLMGWIEGRQQRKCTLCLEEMRDPSVTTCGHVFCWGCIKDWIREKPECPLCRQGILGQHVLPLRG